MDPLSLLQLDRDVKSIALFGLGRSNLDILGRIPREIRVIIRSDTPLDKRTTDALGRECAVYDGARACESITEDVIVFSPSVRRERPALIEAHSRGTRFTSDAELFFSAVSTPVFAISGSDGKSTTTTLVGELLREKYPNASVCGNIGTPMLGALGASAYAVELSSFQLTYVHPRAHRAAITNITENHLNWHKDFEEYKSVKLSLLDNAHKTVVSPDDSHLREYLERRGAFCITSFRDEFRDIKKKYRTEHAYTLEGGYICRDGEKYIDIDSLGRREAHNIKNALTALAMCEGEVSREYASDVLSRFRGLEHRCEHFATLCGVDFINSSIDTSPARCAATLVSLGRRATVLIGGRGKGLSFEPLVPILEKYAVRVIAFGECREEIARACYDRVTLTETESLDEAVQTAISHLGESECVILSPAATSYDAYSSFEERGRDFKGTVLKHIENTRNAK